MLVVSSCETDTPLFSECIEPIILNNCTSCHSYGGDGHTALDLSNYDNIQEAVLNGNVIERINSINNPMPPSGKLSDLEIQIIEKWSQNGALNN